MRTVGVRELRQRAGALLRLVQQGEAFEITDRGHPVAMLGPLAAGDELERLRATGPVRAATGTLDDLPAPLALEPGSETGSQVLSRLRHDER